VLEEGANGLLALQLHKGFAITTDGYQMDGIGVLDGANEWPAEQLELGAIVVEECLAMKEGWRWVIGRGSELVHVLSL